MATQDALANRLTGTALALGTSVSLADFNLYLETGTLILGFTAGVFALYFHIRRLRREKAQKNEVDS